MAEYWVGPSLRQNRRTQWMAPERRTSGQPRPAERRVARPLTPRRWRALLRLANVKLHDVTFLARYAAHVVVLVVTCAVSLLHGTDFSQYLKPSQTYAAAPRTMVWATGSDDQAAYLRWGALPQTIIPEHPAAARYVPIPYQVQAGDNPSTIAARFGLQPTTIVWANSAAGENPDLLETGQALVIPPVDGVLHTIEAGDTLTALAQEYKVDVNAVVGFPGNNFSTADDPLIVGQQVMVPGGVVPLAPPPPPPPPAPPPRPVVQSPPVAVAPAPRAAAPVAPVAPAPAVRPAPAAPAASTTRSTSNYQGATGCCIWPVRGRITQNPSSYHMALDIAAPTGTPVYAADGGKVTWSGWDNTGYGYAIKIDHGNGIVTLYAHHSYLNVRYGDYVNKGALIGRVGSTGRSTGPHLHFEVRRSNGYRLNPYNWLP